MSYIIEYSLPLECIDREELIEKLAEDHHIILVDTIGRYDGNEMKIRGALTIPYPEVIDRRKELSEYDEIIIYCKNRQCKASKKVALGLKLLNVPNVKVYEGGIDEWAAEGLPVEKLS